ncbi:hypothetical protein HHK36_002121 [Tetracentron sinense]|uniref:SURP motif domain-containing protein n=1 Tax=Tetracentron sinense TaxID=13715 RepID=A0A835DVP6_TETSI|nr:hypothetical protein HHK36_002121 [Tetracentron sinense]
MDLEVVGRHALLFDDDSNAAFVNSRDALVEWNSLLIDRYDVCHYYDLVWKKMRIKRGRRTRKFTTNSKISSDESSLWMKLYLIIFSPNSGVSFFSSFCESNNGAESARASAFHAVAFSYGNPDVSVDLKNTNAGLEYSGTVQMLVSCLLFQPPTEKLHQIIARTAIFVSKHGGQSEIVLRVKQGDNPTFGFLMPDHHLHEYFRFLVDHPELLKSDMDVKPQEEEKKADTKHTQTDDAAGGALSLLGSVYGSGEDEDGALQVVTESKEQEPAESFNAANATLSNGSEQEESSASLTKKEETVPKNSHPAAKEKAPSSKRNRFVTAVNASTTYSKKREGDSLASLCGTMDRSQVSALSSTSKVEPMILEPPSDLKRLMGKVVEFVLKNGKEFEAILVEQDSKNGRFPFLLPLNQYHPYYLKALQNAQESKLLGKSFAIQKHDSTEHGLGRKTALSKENETLSMPYDSERKEKFKMVIGGSKKDSQDLPSKPAKQQFGVSVDAAAAAAILQAATRGLRNPKLDILPKTSVNDFGQGLTSESEKEDGRTSNVSVARAIAKTAAIAAASEADSSEACLTKEQKQKAERLKRAKMFAAMIKTGGAPRTNESLPHLSADPPGADIVDPMVREREGSSVPVDVDTSDRMENSEKGSVRKKRHFRSRRVEQDDDEEEEGRDHKHSRKKHRSHKSSHHSRDDNKHRKRHSSSKDSEYRHRHKHHSSSEDEHRHKRKSRSHSKREVELEDGEISTKLSGHSNTDSIGDGASRETSLDLSNDRYIVFISCMRGWCSCPLSWIQTSLGSLKHSSIEEMSNASTVLKFSCSTTKSFVRDIHAQSPIGPVVNEQGRGVLSKLGLHSCNRTMRHLLYPQSTCQEANSKGYNQKALLE